MYSFVESTNFNIIDKISGDYAKLFKTFKIVGNGEFNSDILKKYSSNIFECNKEMKKLVFISELNNLKNNNNFIDSFGKLIGKKTMEVKELLDKEIKEEKLIESDQKEKDNKASLKMIKNLKVIWFDMDFDEQRRIIEHLIDKVVVNDNEINIYYNIY